MRTVVRLTGIAPDTLRAWERRYGVPTPRRTASAYRLYSGRDVEVVRRVRDLCAAGLSVADFVKNHIGPGLAKAAVFARVNGQDADHLVVMNMVFGQSFIPVFYDKDNFHKDRGVGKEVNFLYADGHINKLLEK